tara:strand:- start:262 stop:867 length:606 start_codon:yes stop_codon:yes gene_type:complete
VKKYFICFGLGSTGKYSINILKKEKYSVYKVIKKNFTRINYKKILKVTNKAIIGFADIKDLSKNEDIFNFLKKKKFNFVKCIHETALVNESSQIKEGCKIFSRVIIGPNVNLGKNILINNGSIVEHDVTIGDHSQVAPGSKIAGNVKIGKKTLIGIGSVIKEGVKIGSNCIVGAGSVVIKDLERGFVYAGVPAKKIKKNYD